MYGDMQCIFIEKIEVWSARSRTHLPTRHTYTYKMASLKPNSIVHRDGQEYYLGDLPGTLQYKKTREELISITNLDHQDSDCGYAQVAVTADLTKRFVPNTDTGRKGDWELLVVFKSNTEHEGTGELRGKKINEAWMKAALRNKKTGEVALMTSTNNKNNITRHGNRALDSLEAGWFVGFYRMGAPMVFWRAVAAAVA